MMNRESILTIIFAIGLMFMLFHIADLLFTLVCNSEFDKVIQERPGLIITITILVYVIISIAILSAIHNLFYTIPIK